MPFAIPSWLPVEALVLTGEITVLDDDVSDAKKDVAKEEKTAKENREAHVQWPIDRQSMRNKIEVNSSTRVSQQISNHINDSFICNVIGTSTAEKACRKRFSVCWRPTFF